MFKHRFLSIKLFVNVFYLFDMISGLTFILIGNDCVTLLVKRYPLTSNLKTIFQILCLVDSKTGTCVVYPKLCGVDRRVVSSALVSGPCVEINPQHKVHVTANIVHNLRAYFCS